MSWFYQKKRMFLIRLLQALGFGSVIAYSICSCDSKPNADQTNKPESQAVPSAPKTEPSQDANAAPQNAVAPNADSPADADANPQNAAAPNTDSPADANPQNTANAVDPNAEPASNNTQNANTAVPECQPGDCDTEKKRICRNGNWFPCGSLETCDNGKCVLKENIEPAVRPTEYRARMYEPKPIPEPAQRETKYRARIPK